MMRQRLLKSIERAFVFVLAFSAVFAVSSKFPDTMIEPKWLAMVLSVAAWGIFHYAYQLCYFDKGKQVIVGTVTATDSKVTFGNVPSGALYILHDLTEGSEERIFSYEKGQIDWY